MDVSYAWLGLLLLGGLHGINPGMGWLFAVALGLQEQRRAAVWQALLPLACGHALAIAAALALGGLVGVVVPQERLKWVVAAVLLGFGVYRLLRTRHPRYGGMQVGARDLTIWSFLMASAHGAGLMVLPFLFHLNGGGAVSVTGGHSHGARALVDGGTAVHAQHFAPGAAHDVVTLAGITSEQLIGVGATLVHAAGYLLVTGLIAVIVYEKLGLGLLRRMWFNLDRVWAATLIVTGLLTPLF
jgi:hypothetical protein